MRSGTGGVVVGVSLFNTDALNARERKWHTGTPRYSVIQKWFHNIHGMRIPPAWVSRIATERFHCVATHSRNRLNFVLFGIESGCGDDISRTIQHACRLAIGWLLARAAGSCWLALLCYSTMINDINYQSKQYFHARRAHILSSENRFVAGWLAGWFRCVLAYPPSRVQIGK